MTIRPARGRQGRSATRAAVIAATRLAVPATMLGLLVVLAAVAPAAAGEPAAARDRLARGDSLRAAGRLDEAEAEYQAALDVDDGLCEARYGLARIDLARSDPGGAEKRVGPCKGKVKSEPYYLLGTALARLGQGRLGEAEILLIRAATRSPGDPFRLDVERALADLYEAKDVPRLAIDHLDQVIALSPSDPAPLVRKGRLLVGLKDYEAAVAAFRAAAAADSHAVEPHLEIASIYTRAKRPADAAQALARVAAIRGGAADYLALGAAWDAARETAKALEAYRRAADIDPTADVARLALARAAFEAGQRDTALLLYEGVRDSSRLTARDLESIGRAHLDRKDYARSREAYLKAAALDSTRIDALFYAGYGYFADRMYAEAIPLFERRIAVDSTSAASFSNLGLCYLQTGALDRGIEMLGAAVRLRPDDADSRTWLAQALAARERWPRAVEEYRAAVRLDSANADAWRGLGYSLLNQERLEEAVAALARADALDPRNVQGLVWLAQGYGMLGQLDKAESVFRKVLAIEPSSREAKEGLEAIEKVNKRKPRKKPGSP